MIRRRVPVFFSVLLCSLPASLPAGLAAGAEIQPHRASYVLQLSEAALQGPIANATGELMAEVVRTCEGTTIRQEIQLLVTAAAGDLLSTNVTTVITENEAGTELVFRVEIVTGDVVETWAGTARTGAEDGLVLFEDPPGQQLDLPAGAVFPVTHSRALLDAAAEGRRFLTTTLFEGGGPQSLTIAAAVIGERRDPLTESEAPFPALAGRAAWRADFAHYFYTTAGAEPDYQVSYLAYEGAILDQLDLDYTAFRIAGALTELELLPAPDC